jgi:hypothetical protein
MKLKLSTLLLIIVVIFAAYYFFVYSPCQNKVIPSTDLTPPLQQLTPPLQRLRNVPMIENDITYLMQDDYPPLPEPQVENFEINNVRPYDNEEQYSLAGNVRPDNVMIVSEPVSYV